MNPDDSGIRRILLALSGVADDPHSIEAAAELAVWLEAELAALFVEDIDLLRACRLPSMQEIGRQSAELRQLPAARLEHALRTTARRLQTALERAAQARALRCSFAVLQGKPTATALSLAGELDLVLLSSQSPGRPKSDLAPSVAVAAAAALRLRPAPSGYVGGRSDRRTEPEASLPHRATPAVLRPRAIVVFYDGSITAATTLAVAMRLARAAGRHCQVLIAAADADTYRQQLEQARWAIGARQDVAVERLADAAPAALAQAVNRLRPAALLLPMAYAEGDVQRIDTLREYLHCDLLLVV